MIDIIDLIQQTNINNIHEQASRKTSTAQTDSVGEEIETLSDSGSVIIRQKVIKSSVLLI